MGIKFSKTETSGSGEERRGIRGGIDRAVNKLSRPVKWIVEYGSGVTSNEKLEEENFKYGLFANKSEDGISVLEDCPNANPLFRITKEPFTSLYYEDFEEDERKGVFPGIRLHDKIPLSFKRVKIDDIKQWRKIDGVRVPLEVFLLHKLIEVRGVGTLVDYREDGYEAIIITERPRFSVSLKDYISETGRLSEEVAKRIFAQIAETIEECHQAGVVHLDLKEENILLDTKLLTVKIVEFGCGREIWDGPSKDYAGTIRISPPEMHCGEEYFAESSVVWSLGVLLFTMVTGNQPFESRKALLKNEIRFPGYLTGECFDLLEACLAPEKGRRISLNNVVNSKWVHDIRIYKAQGRLRQFFRWKNKG